MQSMAGQDTQDIDAKVQKSLEGTQFATSALQKLSGGSVNWIYHAPLDRSLKDGTTSVAIKHGEKFMASKPDFELNFVRSRTEAEFFKSQSDQPFTGSADLTDPFIFTVRTPKFYEYDVGNNNQITEYLPNSIDLKNYILSHYAAPTPPTLQPQCYQLGKAIGQWRKLFADWSQTQPELRRFAGENHEAQDVRHWVHFSWLYERIKDYPAILKDVKDILGEVEQMAHAEHKQDADKLQLIHGDFWTGNVLIPNKPIQEGKNVPILVIDWEMAQLNTPNVDYGEMIAELYALWLYKGITAGRWIMEGFVKGYRTGNVTQVDFDSAFRTAIQAGAHLLCITTTFPGWGTAEQVEHVARVGRDLIVNAWKKDLQWFQNSELECLFR